MPPTGSKRHQGQPHLQQRFFAATQEINYTFGTCGIFHSASSCIVLGVAAKQRLQNVSVGRGAVKIIHAMLLGHDFL